MRWLGTSQRRQLRLLFTVENRLDGRRLATLAAEDGLKTLLDQQAAHPVHHAFVRIQRFDDPCVRPTFAQRARIRLQQDTRLQKGARRRLALADQALEMIPLRRAQFNDISLL